MKPHTIDINTKSSDFLNKIIKAAVVIVLLLAVLGYYFRPLFHDFAMFFYTNPIITFLLLVILIAAGGSLWKAKQKGENVFIKGTNFSPVVSIAIMLLVLVFIFGAPLLDALKGKYIYELTEYNKIDEMASTSDIRIVPLGVASRYLVDSLQKSREKVGNIEILYINNTLMWGAPRIPDGTLLYYTQKVNGLITTKASDLQKNIKLYNQEFPVADGIGFFDNIYWKIYKEKFFVTPDNIIYVFDNESNDFKIIVPFISYKFKFPVMVPYFGGVYVIDKEGNIDIYSPEEAAEIDYIKSTWVYPETLARQYVDSYKYNNGIINTWFIHEDQIEIADTYDRFNRQPFLMDTEEGLKWIVAVEPYGQSYGIFKIFFVDAVTGEMELYELGEESSLTGPVRAVDYVKQKFPTIDWYSATIVEPRPYVVDSVLYWMLSITPNDYAGVTYTVFLNSENNEMHAFQTLEEIEDFIRGGIVVDDDDDNETEEITNEIIIDKIEFIEDELEELKEMLSE